MGPLQGVRVIELAGAAIVRVSYHGADPDRLLIAGQWIREGEPFTLDFDLRTGQQGFIGSEQGPVQECAFLEDLFLYRLPGVEVLQTLGRPRFRPVRAAVVRRPSITFPVQEGRQGSCGCRGGRAVPIEDVLLQPGPGPTRPSCLECVEKHLGSAYVLLTEARNGYAHRLRAVGHLHEAEDESQAWAALHRAVGVARRAYQVHGAMPDCPCPGPFPSPADSRPPFAPVGQLWGSVPETWHRHGGCRGPRRGRY